MLLTLGTIPAKGTIAPPFTLTRTDKIDVSLSDFIGKKIVLNIFPSIDTGTCAASVRRFNQLASDLANTTVICISNDLPFAHKRFCEAEDISNVLVLSQMRDRNFSRDYGLEIAEGSMRGTLYRTLIVLDELGSIIYSSQKENLGEEPDYDAALFALRS